MLKLRTNEQSRQASTAAPEYSGFNLQNLLEKENNTELGLFCQESGLDHTGISMLKKELERG